MRDLEERLAVRQLQSLLRMQSLKRKCKFAQNAYKVSNGNVITYYQIKFQYSQFSIDCS